jgi:hypothetical protein
MMTELTLRSDHLETILQDIWSMLLRGAEQAADPFHCPVLGTVGDPGCSLRTVVLRRVQVAERQLLCHTDRRSRKVAELALCPDASWLFYHPQAKIQLQIGGTATLHRDDALADRQWAASKPMSRRCYCALDAPGTAVSRAWSGLPDTLVSRSPTVQESEAGRQHFVVIACRVTRIDWLYLKADGHRRARFYWNTSGFHATWLTP